MSALVIEGVEEDAGVVVVRASTPGSQVTCPDCGVLTGRVHGYFGRQVADAPVDGRRVVVRVRARRMRCPRLSCPRQTFREQPAGVSIMSLKGVDIQDISDTVGHKSTHVTETVYRHVIAPAVTGSAAVMDDVFGEGD